MSEPNLPLNIDFKEHGQTDGIDDRPLLEGRRQGFYQTGKGRGRKDLAPKGTVPEAAMRYKENP